ncbi:MAG: flagella basal body P-ring formation protein FlgA [Deltaproteobacteria bacterium]|nr:flagella basal body P-ring formation protein FlgA [Deltaproteobacteria bacterium]
MTYIDTSPGPCLTRAACCSALVLLVTFGPTGSASAMAPTSIEVDSDRVVLGDIVRDVPVALADVDLGPAPEPGHAVTLSKKQIEARLAMAMVDRDGVKIPKLVTISRPGQTIAEPHLKGIIADALNEILPAGVTLGEVRAFGGLVLGRGPILVETVLPARLHSGFVSVWVKVTAGSSSRKLPVTIELFVPKAEEAALVKRGDRVQLVIRTVSMTIRAFGIAQNEASAGQLVNVLPTQGRKIVAGRVVAKDEVEVVP